MSKDTATVNTRGEYVNFGLQWLLDHHSAKEQQRIQMINDLNIQPGDVVLDLGCGPGLWTSLIAEKVKPHGRVVGLDTDPEFIQYATERFITKEYEGLIEFHQGNFYSTPFANDSFDLIFFGNCFAYVTDHQKILTEQKRVVRDNGRIAVKDFDGSALVVHPVEPLLTLKVITAAAQALDNDPPDPPFDNFSGRKLLGILIKAGLKNVSSISYGVQIVQPLTPEEKRYIIGNTNWYAEKGRPYLSDADFNQWQAYFDAASEKYVFDLEEFYFSMLEVVTIGNV